MNISAKQFFGKQKNPFLRQKNYGQPFACVLKGNEKTLNVVVEFNVKKILFLFLAATCLPFPAFGAITAAQLVEAAIERTTHFIIYDGSYSKIPYPGGDVSPYKGVCTDVVIRSYRKLGIDLQERVHLDMKQNFSLYPSKKLWGLTTPDTNIDHRRVPNLQTFFSRKGQSLPITRKASDYKPGDIVTWTLPNGRPHIGIVTDRFHHRSGNPMIVHNIGWGPKLEDMLFDYTISGHYQYFP